MSFPPSPPLMFAFPSSVDIKSSHISSPQIHPTRQPLKPETNTTSQNVLQPQALARILSIPQTKQPRDRDRQIVDPQTRGSKRISAISTLSWPRNHPNETNFHLFKAQYHPARLQSQRPRKPQTPARSEQTAPDRHYELSRQTGRSFRHPSVDGRRGLWV
jgi:hypothetical protein